MASIDNALTTLSRAKSYLGISGSSKDFVLTMIILAVSKFVESYTGRNFKAQTYTQQLYNGKDSPRLWLKAPPIDPGVTVVIQGRNSSDAGDDWETLDTDDYLVNYDSGYIERLYGDFVAGEQNYRVTYKGGYTLPSDSGYQDGTDDNKDLPYDLELAVLDLVASGYNSRQTQGVKSQKVGDVSITYGDVVNENSQMKATLDSYKVSMYA